MSTQNDPILFYIPFPDYFGVDSFEYEVCDSELSCDTWTVSLFVHEINDDPTLSDDPSDNTSTLNEDDINVEIPLTADDVEGDVLIYQITIPPENGTYTQNLNENIIEYTPDKIIAKLNVNYL